MFSYHGANGPESSTTLFSRVRQVAVPVVCQTNLQCLVEFFRSGTGAKSPIYDCLVEQIVIKSTFPGNGKFTQILIMKITGSVMICVIPCLGRILIPLPSLKANGLVDSVN